LHQWTSLWYSLLYPWYKLVPLMHVVILGALTPSAYWKLILGEGEEVLYEIMSRFARPPTHWLVGIMTRGFLQYHQSGIVPWTLISCCLRFVIRKCRERIHEDTWVFAYVICSLTLSFIFISMKSNVAFSLCTPWRHVVNGDRSPLILSFVLGVLSHLSKIQMYCWTFNPANHAVYWVNNNWPHSKG
jgi:hypothetical protein